MPYVDSSPTAHANARLMRLSRIGYWVSAAAVLLMAVVIGVTFYLALIADTDFSQKVILQLGIVDHVDTLTRPQLWLAALIWSSINMLGLYLLIEVRALFAGLLSHSIFATPTITRLRRIGIVILCMAPVSIASKTLAGMLVTFWHTGDQVHGTLSVLDSDIYALVIGLVITAISHMMLEAARLSEENQAFV